MEVAGRIFRGIGISILTTLKITVILLGFALRIAFAGLQILLTIFLLFARVVFSVAGII